MNRPDWMLRVLLLAIGLSLGVIAIRPYVHPEQTALAFTGKFDYVTIVSPMYQYKGITGVLLLDTRNGNVWFIGRGDEAALTFRDPVFVVRLPLEKIDQAPQ